MEPDSYERRARQIDQLRKFLQALELNDSAIERFFVSMIEEGGATWDDKLKAVAIDYRYADGPAYRIQFLGDGRWKTLPPLENN